MTGPWTLRLPPEMMSTLDAHLFPGDGDEHGAVIGASVVSTDRGTRLLARRIFLAADGVDYVPGQRGYRMLTSSFVSDCVLDCDEEGLAYLAVHCHGGRDRVGFSGDDLASHERGYPALLEILDGKPAGGLVFARNAVAGDIWLSSGERAELSRADIPGIPNRVLRSSPRRPLKSASDLRFDRQVRLFGDEGQEVLSRLKVVVIGAGGAGSLVVEYLSRLGVGDLVVIDPDRIDPTNLPRVVGSTTRDTRPLLTHPRSPRWLQRWGAGRRAYKTTIARRVAREANPSVRFSSRETNVVEPKAADDLLDADVIFLAADTMQARLLFNAFVHQYLVPGVQMGAKVQVDQPTGEILDAFSVIRPVIPGLGCLWCNGLISPAKLQEEATNVEQLRRQRYVEDDDVPAPSVITLNAVAAGNSVNWFLFNQLGLQDPRDDLRWMSHSPTEPDVAFDLPRRQGGCRECEHRLGAGASIRLPTATR